jgi:hypothetical protein
VIRSLLAVCERNKDRVDPVAIPATVEWRATSSSLVTSGSHGTDHPGRGQSATAEIG